jgi:hypothetical protein
MYIVRTHKKTLEDFIEVVPQVPANWYTNEGAKKKFHLLEKKGLPSFYNWRFLTLTIDKDKFKSNQSAYEYVKPRLRYFIRDLKKFLGVSDLQYLWKLEFQENGNPHWHMIINYQKPICITTLFNIWGFGYIDIQRIKCKKIPYAFKYITKSIEGLPEWFLQYNRPRVFQSSGIFPPCNDPCWSVEKKDEEEVELVASSSSPETLGQRLTRYSKSITLKKEGRAFKNVFVACSFGVFLSIAFQYSFTKFHNAYCIEIPTDQIQLLI